MRRGALLLAAALTAGVAPAQVELFNEGNRLYQQGDFGGAIASYSAVLEGGFESAELYYNLGNAHFRRGSWAEAVLSYERAARLDPGNEDVRENLRLVRQRLTDRIEPLPRFWLFTAADWWTGAIPRALLQILVVSSYFALALGLVAMVLDRPRGGRVWGRRIAVIAGAATVLLGGTLLARELGWARPEEAIVMVPQVQVLSAPSTEGGLTVFTLHEGTKVRIDQRTQGWVEIVLADGKVGWIRVEALSVI